METEIIITYCICDDMLKKLKIKEDPQVKMTNAEIITTA
ncbi:IS982 family transposase, partial [Candidatus Dependentiae bacterium]|nr:IS982 family transposase [Candidatus Dependentiae bacterium]MBD3231759.1 IS982 family transposase [Candidatus Dependentiae bacterium]